MGNVKENKNEMLNTILTLSGIFLGAFLITKIVHPEQGEGHMIKNLDSEPKPVKTPSMDFNERQNKIISMLQQKRIVTPKELQKLIPNVSDRTLRRDMDTLAKEKIVLQKGSTKSTFYEYIQHEKNNI
jgi:predicted HTH transcriptional regulator